MTTADELRAERDRIDRELKAAERRETGERLKMRLRELVELDPVALVDRVDAAIRAGAYEQSLRSANDAASFLTGLDRTAGGEE